MNLSFTRVFLEEAKMLDLRGSPTSRRCVMAGMFETMYPPGLQQYVNMNYLKLFGAAGKNSILRAPQRRLNRKASLGLSYVPQASLLLPSSFCLVEGPHASFGDPTPATGRKGRLSLREE